MTHQTEENRQSDQPLPDESVETQSENAYGDLYSNHWRDQYESSYNYDDQNYLTQGAEATAVLTAENPHDEAREERNRRLGVRTREPETQVYTETTPQVRTTDKWHGTLAMFLLRLITAGIVGYHGWQHCWHFKTADGTRNFFTHSLLPKPELFAWGVTIAELSIAALLVLGLLTRLAGLALVAVEVVMLCFFIWGHDNPFPAGKPYFLGELELLLAAVGFLLLLLGSGGAGVDAAIRQDRARRKARRAAGDL